MGCIYLIRNLINNKCYVGLSIHDAKKTRIRQHLSGHGSKLIKKAIEKYGIDAFHSEIISDGIAPELLCEIEKHEIKRYNSIVPNGYNLTSGGEKGKVHSPESRKKMSKSLKGRKAPNKGQPMSKEQREKMSKSLKGKPAPNKGQPLSKETKEKLSKSLKGRQAHNKGKPMSDAQKKKLSKARKGIHISTETKAKISKSLKGRPAPNKGKPASKETRQKMSEAQKGKKNHFHGKKHTKQTKKKISDANKRNHATS